jgi:hypothetical protein
LQVIQQNGDFIFWQIGFRLPPALLVEDFELSASEARSRLGE